MRFRLSQARACPTSRHEVLVNQSLTRSRFARTPPHICPFTSARVENVAQVKVTCKDSIKRGPPLPCPIYRRFPTLDFKGTSWPGPFHHLSTSWRSSSSQVRKERQKLCRHLWMVPQFGSTCRDSDKPGISKPFDWLSWRRDREYTRTSIVHSRLERPVSKGPRGAHGLGNMAAGGRYQALARRWNVGRLKMPLQDSMRTPSPTLVYTHSNHPLVCP